MRSEQLSSTDQKRVSDALAKCAAATKSIDDPQQLEDAAYNIFKESLGDNPRLIKVASRVYNSCKNIHKLASADDSTRDRSFGLLNPEKMAQRAVADGRIALCKKASAPATFGVLEPVKPTVNAGMQKAASATVTTKIQGIVPEVMSGAAKKEAVVRTLQDWEDLVKEASGELTIARNNFTDALEVFVATMCSMPTHLRKSAAAKVYANYGKFAESALAHFNEARPMYKMASSDYVGKYRGTPIIDDADVARATDNLYRANEKYLAKKAYLDRAVLECFTAIKDLFSGMQKSASISDAVITSGIVSDLGKGVPSFLGYDYSDDYAKGQLANIEIENAILAAGSRRAFVKALTDDAIASYPLPKIIEAFNKAYSKLPPSVRRMPATRSQALINAEMIASLAEDNTPSKADREHLLMTMKNFDYNTPVGVVSGLVSQ
jgi:tetratricopeptide (TPR) repeat protein